MLFRFLGRAIRDDGLAGGADAGRQHLDGGAQGVGTAEGDEHARAEDEAGEDELLPARQPRPVQVREVERPEAPSRTLA